MLLNTNRRMIVLLGVFAQVLLTAIFLWRLEIDVEGQLEAASKQSLQNANLKWARVEADGLDLNISGIAPTARLKERAIELIGAIDGVRVVNDELLVATAQAPSLAPEEAERRAQELLSDIEDDAPIFTVDLPYELHLAVEASVITLSGLVPDDVAKESLLNLANRAFGDGRVIDRLIVSPGAPPNYLTAATRAIDAAALISRGMVIVNDHEVIVQGLIAGAGTPTELERLLADLPADYAGNLQVGDQRELDALLRMHPSLANRVGTLSGGGIDETVIETVPVTTAGTDTTVVAEPSEPASSVRPEPAFTAQTTVTQVTQSLDATECAYQLQAEISRQGIGFETGSSDIDEASQPLMRTLVRIAKQCPQAVLEIAGHTDDLGTRENNLALSQRRAESVMAFLVRNGVSLSRLRAVGYGEERPLVENTTAERRKMNRRIEVSLADES